MKKPTYSKKKNKKGRATLISTTSDNIIKFIYEKPEEYKVFKQNQLYYPMY